MTYDPNKATTTDLNNLSGYSVAPKSLDYSEQKEESYWYFSDAAKNFGYYKQIPELKQSVDSLALWTAGKGYTTSSTLTRCTLDFISGWGEDTVDSIFKNMIIVKKVVGDSFGKAIYDTDKKDRLINIKPISPERVRLVLDKNAVIKRYDILVEGVWQPVKKEEMLHLSNNRLGDEIHGQSVIDSVKWIIEARNEAMDTYRKIMKRSLALGILYVDTNDAAVLNDIKARYKEAIDKGEVLVLPRDTAEIKDANVSVKDFLSWIGYLENFFYQAVGIPKIILGGSQDFTEASSKVGYLTFEQVYMAEQRELEQDIWKQLGLRITFNRPVSLKDEVVSSEAANTGQVGFQPKESSINTQRE